MGRFDSIWCAGKICSAVKSWYGGNSACVRVRCGVREWSEINVGVCRGCVMSPCLYNVVVARSPL